MSSRKNHKAGWIEKQCPVCEEYFKTKRGKTEKITCSVTCANQWRSIPSHKKKRINYRKICFENHERRCIICGEGLAIDVHHFDKNRKNNNPENLIPICPTHHRYLHRKNLRDLIYEQVLKYRTQFINERM